ncbi:hypothetical protein MOD68_05480 [Bacillus spizizenii]|nr:hypothetical protein [Bacillus spizizenii]
MKKGALIKRVSFLTAAALMASIIIPESSSASISNDNQESVLDNVLITEKVDGISSDSTLDKTVLSKDFDLEEEVEKMPSVDEMNVKEKKLFDQIVQEQAELSGVEDTELFEQLLTDFFDESSDTYNDLPSVQNELEEEIEEKSSSNEDLNQLAVLNTFNDHFGVKKAQAAVKIGVGVKVAGAILNTAIGFAVGGGVGAIQSFIIKKGKKQAQKIFTRTVTSRLKAWGAKKLAVSVGVCVSVALNYLDIGTQIAKQLDKRDKRPNNGWVDFY